MSAEWMLDPLSPRPTVPKTSLLESDSCIFIPGISERSNDDLYLKRSGEFEKSKLFPSYNFFENQESEHLDNPFKNSNKAIFNNLDVSNSQNVHLFVDTVSLRPQQTVEIRVEQEALESQQKSNANSPQHETQAVGKKVAKTVNRNKNIVRDICTKCALYLDLNPRAQKEIKNWVQEDLQKKKQVKEEIQKIRIIKNFEGFKEYYEREQPVVQLMKKLTMKFYDQEAYVYICNSSITYKKETINQIGHFKYGLQNPSKFNQYRKWPSQTKTETTIE